jgi:hypothetical protein
VGVIDDGGTDEEEERGFDLNLSSFTLFRFFLEDEDEDEEDEDDDDEVEDESEGEEEEDEEDEEDDTFFLFFFACTSIRPGKSFRESGRTEVLPNFEGPPVRAFPVFLCCAGGGLGLRAHGVRLGIRLSLASKRFFL